MATDKEYPRIIVTVPVKLLNAIDKLAAAEYTTRSNFIRQLLADKVRHSRKQPDQL